MKLGGMTGFEYSDVLPASRHLRHPKWMIFQCWGLSCRLSLHLNSLSTQTARQAKPANIMLHVCMSRGLLLFLSLSLSLLAPPKKVEGGAAGLLPLRQAWSRSLLLRGNQPDTKGWMCVCVKERKCVIHHLLLLKTWLCCFFVLGSFWIHMQEFVDQDLNSKTWEET